MERLNVGKKVEHKALFTRTEPFTITVPVKHCFNGDENFEILTDR